MDAKTQTEKAGKDALAKLKLNYSAELVAALQKLKSSKDLAFEFLICDAKPFCGVILAKKITSRHRAELTKATGGGTHFLPVGTCVFEDGKFDFRLQKPVQGLATKLHDSFKNFTGRKFPIKAGLESAADADGQSPDAVAGPKQNSPGAGPSPNTDAPAPRAAISLEQAPQHWHSTRGMVDGIIKGLKRAVLAEYANDGQELVAEIDKTMSTLDVILDKLDRRLAESLDKAGATQEPAARQAELKNSKAILAQYINYVKSEQLIELVDANPLRIQTNLKLTLAGRLTQMAQAIG